MFKTSSVSTAPNGEIFVVFRGWINRVTAVPRANTQQTQRNELLTFAAVASISRELSLEEIGNLKKMYFI